jgi:hypothetical protein
MRLLSYLQEKLKIDALKNVLETSKLTIEQLKFKLDHYKIVMINSYDGKV